MKPSEKLVGAFSYAAGILATGCALLLIVFIVLAELGGIHPRKIRLTLETETVSRMYDGEQLTGGARIVYGELCDGHSIRVVSQSSISRVGTVDNEMDILIQDETGATVSDRYEIEIVTGRLRITPRVLRLETRSRTGIYTGDPLLGRDPQISGGSLAQGDTLAVMGRASITEIGTMESTAEVCIISEDKEDVTNQYEISARWGTLTVMPRSLTIRAESASKFYDGTPLESAKYAVTSGSLAKGHSIAVINNTRLDSIGKASNDMEFAILDATANDVTSYYNISVIPGTLEIKPISLHVSTGSDSKTYDGIPASSSSWSLKGGGLLPGDSLHAVEMTEFDGVGSVDNAIRLVAYDAAGNDVSECYHIDYSYGKLSVTPRKLSIQMDSVTEKYTGQEVSCNTYRILSGSLCQGHTLTVVGKTRTNVGVTYNDVVSYTIHATQNGTTQDVSDCYQLTYTGGTITVTAP